MVDATADTAAAKPKSDPGFYPTVRVIHKWAGLAGLAWLSVLGITGWILDHQDWRWTHQWAVPEWVTSARIDRLVNGTVMRHIEVDQNDPARWIGASERGLWLTENAGEAWVDIPFQGMSGHPQVFRFVPAESHGLDLIYLATDDGIWTISSDEAAAQPFALHGQPISALGQGSTTTELVGAVHHGQLFRFDVRVPDEVTWIDVDEVVVHGLPETVSLYNFIFDLHVGEGTLPQPWSILINDYGGISMGTLGLTGLMFWWLPRKWRNQAPKRELKKRQQILRWLYRCHGPVIGILAIIPILYLSITGIAVDHIFFLMDKGKGIPLARENLTPIYDYTSLEGEITHVVAFPGDPSSYAVATRFGVLNSDDGGRTWAVDESLPTTLGTDAGNVNLFREGEFIFVGVGSKGNGYRKIDETGWTFVEMPADLLAITDVTRRGDTWYLKNSRGISSGTFNDNVFEATNIPYPALEGTTFFLFMADVHTGNTFHSEFIWVNDLVALMAIILAITGPLAWWKRKWM
ncbi:MAG: PepSY-associated TM helix domain-containing protein [Rhodospirillaceae bacterium]|nr:PepSY-associated TM helix domain-containing protein [Rhodospirillaceae bacterium]